MREKLTEHFYKDEVECPDCGALPSKAFMSRVEELRIDYGHPISVSSCARCVAHNREIGGANGSHHIVSIDGVDDEDTHGAIDIRMKPRSSDLRYELIRCAYSAGFTGIEIGTHHIHLDTRTTVPILWTGISK